MLSARLLEGRLSVVDTLEPNTQKTAEMAKALEKMRWWSSSRSCEIRSEEEEVYANDGKRVLLVEGREVNS